MDEIRPYCLSIAGYDPTAGAGVLADIKTFEMNGVYGLALITANTSQTDDHFIDVQWIATDIILSQLRMLIEHYEIAVLKIGLVQNSETLFSIIKLAKELQPRIRIVWDPILKSTSGFDFHSHENMGLEFLETNCSLITPNWEEYVALWGMDTAVTQFKNTNSAILIKGGHRKENVGCDLLYENGIITELDGVPFNGRSKHGTGCVLSAAIAANLTLGNSLVESCKKGKVYVEKFILSNETNLGYHYVKI